MESDWNWNNSKNLIIKLGGKIDELWRIWWSICITRIKRKTK